MTDSINTSVEYDSISAFLKSQAIDFLNADAAVYIEGEEDEYFWRNVFKHAKPDKQYEFYYNSNIAASAKGEYRSGSGECVKFYSHTDAQFIVCVDSDYNYLLDTHSFSSTDIVFQTYTYSIENHYCFAANLQSIIQQLTGQNTFDFNIFLTDYSGIIYELFVLSVLSEKKKDGQFSINDFQNTCKISRPPDLSNNGKNELNQLQTKVNAKLSNLQGIYTPQEIKNMKKYLSSKKIAIAETYLSIKGHGLIDLEKTGRPKVINNINNKLLDNDRKAKRSKGVTKAAYLNGLRNTITYTGYWQIDQLVNDIKQKI